MGQRNARPPRGGRGRIPGRIGMAADIVQIVSGLVSIAESGVNMGMQAGETRASGSGENTPKKAEEVKLPHKFEAIVADADSHIDKSSNGKLYEQLYSGVFLNQKRKKYWIDKETQGNSFIMYARDLNIGLGVWHWIPVEETRNVFVEAAELMTASSLDIVAAFSCPISERTEARTYSRF
ncbi:protein PHLOEM PROTEIN 2-LIKE A1-like [Melia azedarach]|uniref:Protein PHLOEM PROTEIN 2-LIKE A1-like n=1 Tax=Melia azedarach TaxID=155640 RepID=A0ACC1WUD1_MELAZ|nr:protein PHLOEM PROTEIN 2-LIKE A1-like [Melia azedarach]